MGAGDARETSVLLAQFCCGPQTALEHKVYFFKKGLEKNISLSYLLSICRPKLLTVSMPITFLGNVIIHLHSLSSFPTSKQFDMLLLKIILTQLNCVCVCVFGEREREKSRIFLKTERVNKIFLTQA